MTPQEKQKLKAMLAMTNVYYGRQPLPDAVVLMQVADLEDLEFEPVMQSLERYRKSPKNKTPPMPADIRELVDPSVRDEDVVNLAVGRICEAQAKFGSYNLDKAREFIGELGWEIVKREGGWTDICKTELREMPIRTSQWRKLGESIYRASAAGRLSTAPALPSPERKQISKQSEGMTAVGAVLQQLTKQEKDPDETV